MRGAGTFIRNWTIRTLFEISKIPHIHRCHASHSHDCKPVARVWSSDSAFGSREFTSGKTLTWLPFWSGVIMRQKSIVILSRETQATLTFKVENCCRWCFWASCKRSLGYQIHFESFSNTLEMLVDNVFAPKRVHGRGSSSKTFWKSLYSEWVVIQCKFFGYVTVAIFEPIHFINVLNASLLVLTLRNSYSKQWWICYFLKVIFLDVD